MVGVFNKILIFVWFVLFGYVMWLIHTEWKTER